ncbi:MAG: hypothetical protein C4555_03305 [Dehalococcoidia bacterium]|nr:MAG: hypothetical protein C4555_03305 [Dehalococcoidia bacterium]
MPPARSKQDYLRTVRPLHRRRDQLVDLQRNHFGVLPDDLAQEKREIERQLYQAGASLWEAFREWSEKECGYKPITGDDLRRYLSEQR